MSLVNAETGEIVAYCTPDEARRITEEIRGAAERIWSLLHEAHERGAWAALGYGSWAEYVQAEFDMSKRHANRLVAQGEVIRAIEAEVGPVGPTIEISEREARDIKPRLQAVTNSIKEKLTEEATAPEPDRVKEIVAEVVAEERAKAKQATEDRAALTDLSQSMERAGFDMDKDSLAERGRWSSNCRELGGMSEPSEFIARHHQYLTPRHIAQAERAYEWLDAFLIELREAE